jgi:hypothetical protein
MGPQLRFFFFTCRACIGKKIFSKTSWPISIKLDANYPFMKGIQVYVNKRPNPHQREDNHKNANIG